MCGFNAGFLHSVMFEEAMFVQNGLCLDHLSNSYHSAQNTGQITPSKEIVQVHC